jgi:gas vesicle protein
MSEGNRTADRLTYLLIGAGIGAVVALLFAPKSGRELRREIADLSLKTIDKGKEAAHALGSKVSGGIEGARESVEHEKGQIAKAIEAGKQAYREERHRGES